MDRVLGGGKAHLASPPGVYGGLFEENTNIFGVSPSFGWTHLDGIFVGDTVKGFYRYGGNRKKLRFMCKLQAPDGEGWRRNDPVQSVQWLVAPTVWVCQSRSL